MVEHQQCERAVMNEIKVGYARLDGSLKDARDPVV